MLMCSIGYNKYGGYCVPQSANHRPAAKLVLQGAVYEPQTIEFMINNCEGGDIVHAGAYFGDFLPALSNGCSGDNRVWAFEPSPENFRCAEITKLLNKLDNVILTNAGLGEEAATLSMVTRDPSGRGLGGASHLITESEEVSGQNVETVQVVSLDEVVSPDRNISIIQFDVEGHEKQALAGAMKSIQRCLPIIIIEDLAENDMVDSTWFNDNILSLGYRSSGSLHGNKVFVHQSSD